MTKVQDVWYVSVDLFGLYLSAIFISDPTEDELKEWLLEEKMLPESFLLHVKKEVTTVRTRVHE